MALYDVVLSRGRVIDPETGLDAVRDVGLNGGTIAAISEADLSAAAASTYLSTDSFVQPWSLTAGCVPSFNYLESGYTQSHSTAAGKNTCSVWFWLVLKD